MYCCSASGLGVCLRRYTTGDTVAANEFLVLSVDFEAADRGTLGLVELAGDRTVGRAIQIHDMATSVVSSRGYLLAVRRHIKEELVI